MTGGHSAPSSSSFSPFPVSLWFRRLWDDDGLENQFEVKQSETAEWNELAFLEWDMDGDGLSDGREHDKPKLDPLNENDSTTIRTTSVGGETQPSEISGVQLLLLDVVGVGIVGAAVLLWRTDNDDTEPPAPNATVTDTDDDDVLTDEGVVLKLLRENRGRMKQVDVVEETGWSKSKVSRLLSRWRA